MTKPTIRRRYSRRFFADMPSRSKPASVAPIARQSRRAVAFVGLNPLVLVYGIGGAHNEPLVLLCCCAPAYSHEDTVLVEDQPSDG